MDAAYPPLLLIFIKYRLVQHLFYRSQGKTPNIIGCMTLYEHQVLQVLRKVLCHLTQKRLRVTKCHSWLSYC